MCTWKGSVLTFIKCQDAKALPRNHEDLSKTKLHLQEKYMAQ